MYRLIIADIAQLEEEIVGLVFKVQNTEPSFAYEFNEVFAISYNEVIINGGG